MNALPAGLTLEDVDARALFAGERQTGTVSGRVFVAEPVRAGADAVPVLVLTERIDSAAVNRARGFFLIGAVLGGCVQDMTILFMSTRRDGRSLGQMARDELGPVGGLAAIIGTLTIMIILIAVLGLVVVNAMKHSPWATATVFATIPIAVLIGLYLRNIRPGRVLEGSLIGIALLLFAVVGGGWVDHQPTLRALFDMDSKPLAWFVIGRTVAAPEAARV